MLYFIGWSLFLLFFKVYLGFKVIGRENVPKTGAFIFASNHTSFLDPILLGVSLRRSLNYMARETLFKKRCLAWVLRHIHVFPIRRHKSNFKAIKESLGLLARGKPLVIFPEGTRSKDRNLKRGKRGIGFIAAKAKVPIIPAYIKGSFEALPRGVSTLRRHPVRVYIGKPMDFDFEVRDKDAYQRISDEIMGKITELRERYG